MHAAQKQVDHSVAIASNFLDKDATGHFHGHLVWIRTLFMVCLVSQMSIWYDFETERSARAGAEF